MPPLNDITERYNSSRDLIVNEEQPWEYYVSWPAEGSIQYPESPRESRIPLATPPRLSTIFEEDPTINTNATRSSEQRVWAHEADCIALIDYTIEMIRDGQITPTETISAFSDDTDDLSQQFGNFQLRDCATETVPRSHVSQMIGEMEGVAVRGLNIRKFENDNQRLAHKSTYEWSGLGPAPAQTMSFF
ncbi:hypothetical protein H072_209 [Dactylellina haptotyla CBS 200.50]|uniref:Uncharacterized protein n=1 Tax=Dactylellina haptotyla (strain CBS 200.50) TaxID=1284197 RepID=S8AY13_DACHA|nr:hypothetical protein H072_209 [Dactylellina haptotyla CBS 200.50]